MNQDMELFELANKGDQAAKEKIVSDNTGLVYSVARRFLGRGYEMEDLYQIGCIGLLKAIERFDFHFEVKFSTYAVPMIMGELKRFLRDDGMIKVSRGLKETAVRVYSARERLEKRLGREPTMEEISAETGISKEDMAYAMESTAGVESLYQTVYQNDSSPVMLVDKLVTEEYEEKMTNHLSLMEALESLEMREIELIRLRYYQDKTQSEVAKRFGTSQVQISRMEKKIMEKMRKYFEA
jgi:RNA polymerase sporulation-specific sigma factor